VGIKAHLTLCPPNFTVVLLLRQHQPASVFLQHKGRSAVRFGRALSGNPCRARRVIAHAESSFGEQRQGFSLASLSTWSGPAWRFENPPLAGHRFRDGYSDRFSRPKRLFGAPLTPVRETFVFATRLIVANWFSLYSYQAVLPENAPPYSSPPVTCALWQLGGRYSFSPFASDPVRSFFFAAKSRNLCSRTSNRVVKSIHH